MLDKNFQAEAVIESLGYEGEGIARIDGIPVFIKGALPGERVTVSITGRKKDFAFARLTGIKESSPDRVIPPCPVFGKCGGCDLQHMSYESQLLFKQKLVNDTIKKYAGIDARAEKCVPSDKQYRYRNKSQLPAGYRDNKIICGFFRARSNDIIEINDCLLHPLWFKDSLKIFKDFFSRGQPAGKLKQADQGLIRHLTARETDGAVIYTVVARRDVKIDLTPLYEELQKINPKKTGLYLNINDSGTNVILGETFIHKHGEKTGRSESGGIGFDVHPASFLQVNDYIKDRIYSSLTEDISAEKRDVIIDAYSGAGLLTAMLSGYGDKVYGIEINEKASGDADRLMAENGIGNVTNITGDSGEILPGLAAGIKNKNSVIIIDPPRKGCEERVLNAIAKSGASAVYYLSCNPATLARDLKILSDSYEIASVRPFDMFPQTAGVETLVRMQSK